MSRVTRFAVVALLAAAPLAVTAAPAAAGPDLPDCEVGMQPSMPPRLYYHCDPL